MLVQAENARLQSVVGAGLRPRWDRNTGFLPPSCLVYVVAMWQSTVSELKDGVLFFFCFFFAVSVSLWWRGGCYRSMESAGRITVERNSCRRCGGGKTSESGTLDVRDFLFFFRLYLYKTQEFWVVCVSVVQERRWDLSAVKETWSFAGLEQGLFHHGRGNTRRLLLSDKHLVPGA